MVEMKKEVDEKAASKPWRKTAQASLWMEARKEVWPLSVGALALIASSSVNQGTPSSELPRPSRYE
jgi:hypothetical protein